MSMIARALCIGSISTLLLAACSHSQGGSTTQPPPTGLPSAQEIAAVPMGHVAGLTDSEALARSIHNPYAGNPEAIAQGHDLFLRLNCASCHGYSSKGGMGPPLVDAAWRYGGLPVQIYKSIHDGRAKGMPAWGAAVPPTDIWKLVAYIQSLGGTVDPSKGDGHSAESGQVAPEVARAGSTNDQPPIPPIRTPVPAGSALSPQQRTPLPVSASSQ